MNTLKLFFSVLFIFAFVSCVNNQPQEASNPMMPEKKPIPESTLEMLSDIINDESADLYFPSESKTAGIDIQSPEEAYKQLVSLYPDKAKQVECWAELNNFYVFSIRMNPEIQNSFFHVLYVPKGGRKFGYYWPST